MAETIKVDGVTGKSVIVKTTDPDVQATKPKNTTSSKAGAKKEAEAVASAIEQEYITASFEFLPTTKIKAKMLIEVVGCSLVVDGVYYLKQVTKTINAGGYVVSGQGIRVGDSTVNRTNNTRAEAVKMPTPKVAEDSSKIATITIQRGDTLSKIAKEYKTTVNYLAELNGIRNVNLIITGDKLKVPAKG